VSDTELRQSWTGDNGTYTDHCDVNGNLVEYRCGSPAVCVGVGDHLPVRSEGTGAVVATEVDCNGSCSEGACRSRCPDFDDVVTYLDIDGVAASFFDETNEQRYDCLLTDDDHRDGFDCTNDPRAGDAEVVTALSRFGSSCTGKTFGGFQLSNNCSYRCSTPEVEPLPVEGCPVKGDLLTYLDVDIGDVSVQNAGDGRIYSCRQVGKCQSDPRPGDQAFVARSQLSQPTCEVGEFGMLHWVDIGRLDERLEEAHPAWKESPESPPKTLPPKEWARLANDLEPRLCRYACEIAHPEDAYGPPEICEAGTLASRPQTRLDPGTRQTILGDNGSFTDRCVGGRLVDYRCETRAEVCWPERGPSGGVRALETGRVIPAGFNCDGYCSAGSCPSRCPQYYAPLEFISVGESTARFRNLDDESIYECELNWDSSSDEFDCRTDPMVGDEVEIVSRGDIPRYCTSGIIGRIGVAYSTEPGQSVCGYECELAN
jgi:hypothetical protein